MGTGKGGRDDENGRTPLEDAVSGNLFAAPPPVGPALVATVIVIGRPERLDEAADALASLADPGSVRTILISEGTRTTPVSKAAGDAIFVSGLAPRYINNAVASLRLSSLPAVVWWRGGSPEALDGLADLADRLVLDVEDPEDVWTHAAALFDHTVVTDLRWTRLTRWRAALAHLFDLPQVRDAAERFESITIDAPDIPAARLFAGWLRSALQWTPAVTISIRHVPRDDAAVPLAAVRLAAKDLTISLGLKVDSECLEASVDGAGGCFRVVPLGAGSLASLIAEELAVRTRDMAFERALAAARDIQDAETHK
jgi:glucose-6-phosphate dehydrogenase assembly protein OpcA